MQRELGSQRGLHRIGRGGEGGVNSVTQGFYDCAAVCFDALTQQRVMTRKRCLHCFMLRFPQPRTALDIGEEKRDRSARQCSRTGTMLGDHSIFYASGEPETVATRSRSSARGRPPIYGGRNASL